MRRPVVWWGIVAALAGSGALLVARPGRDHVSCGDGFRTAGARCMADLECPVPLSRTGSRCEAPPVRVMIPRTRLVVGSSDWEAEGKVAPRTVETGPFAIDAFEVTEGSFADAVVPDTLRAACGMTRTEAADYCRKHDGRLPTEDEWLVAAAGGEGFRYPWGETGAVCRRAAFGLTRGPCANGGTGPDTVGAHPAGDSPLGVHDLGGNVAEWVAEDPKSPQKGIAKGGSWRSELATELRVWARLQLDPTAHDDRVGFRCVHDTF
jgi:formylglycine-generating enzyme required for sulfatase activity